MTQKCNSCVTLCPKYILNDALICRFCTIESNFEQKINLVKQEFEQGIGSIKKEIKNLSDKALIKTNPLIVENSTGTGEEITNINFEDLAKKVFHVENKISKEISVIKNTFYTGKSEDDKLRVIKDNKTGGINNNKDNVMNDTGNTIGINDNWKLVQNKHVVKKNKQVNVRGIDLSNRYECLPGVEESDGRVTKLIGDDVIKFQQRHFCVRDKNNRKLRYYKGAGVDEINKNFDDFTKGDTDDTNYIVHVGINDLRNNKELRAPELINKYRRLMERFRERGRTVTFSAVLPEAGFSNHNRIYNLNIQLKDLCKENNVRYFSAWSEFLKPKDLFTNDGVNLSKVGSARYGRLLNEDLKKFFRDT